MIKKSVDLLKKSNKSLNKEEVSSLNTLRILNGKTLSYLNRARTGEILKNLHEAEFSVFSQWGDDGIIEFLVQYLKIEQKTFIEFGVESYLEANTRFLLVNNNWKGLIMDGSEKNIAYVREDEISWKYDLTAIPVFVTKENINYLISENGFGGEIGLLHIDIDGNDYWIWKKISCISPIIVIVEYNSIFGCEKPWSIPYDEKFYRTNYHHSNLFYGASLLSLCDLAAEKGYYFVGCNSSGNNAYFIRKDKISGLKPLAVNEGYVMSKFRESRDKQGNLTFIGGEDRLREIKGLEIYNTRTNQKETI
jgi:hypothetical protein